MNVLHELKYDENRVADGIERAISHEKNCANRYNPFYLMQETPDLLESIERERENQSQKSL